MAFFLSSYSVASSPDLVCMCKNQYLCRNGEYQLHAHCQSVVAGGGGGGGGGGGFHLFLKRLCN